MFEFLKPKNSPVSVEQKTKEYPAIVQEIHHEFSIASDELLREAKSIIAEAETKDVDKVKRLENLGFKQVQQVTEVRPLLQKAELSAEQIGLVRYYAVEYPNNKFITEQQVQLICYKYGLVCGEVGLYKGFVPEKNLREIERFALKSADKFDISKPIYFATSKNGTDDWKEIDIKPSDFTSEHIKNYINNSYHYIIHTCPHLNNGEGKVVSHLAQPQLVAKKTKMQICAPLKDMDTKGLEISDGYKLTKKINVPDPVVLQPVKGGYLILTAWGDEASDENVVNQKMN